MTATTIPRPAAKRAAAAIRRPTEATVFRAALAVALLHALDDAFLHRGAGVPLDQHVFGALVTLPRRRRRLGDALGVR